MHCSWELNQKKKKKKFTLGPIKIIKMVLSLSVTPCLSPSLSMLKLSSSLKTLSGKLSQHHSLKLPYSPLPAWLILNIAITEARHHRPTSRPKPPISLRPTPPSTLDPHGRSPRTHFSFVLSLSLSLSLSISPFLAPIGSHITRLTSNRSIPFHFTLIIIGYDHWSMISAGLVGRYQIG